MMGEGSYKPDRGTVIGLFFGEGFAFIALGGVLFLIGFYGLNWFTIVLGVIALLMVYIRIMDARDVLNILKSKPEYFNGKTAQATVENSRVTAETSNDPFYRNVTKIIEASITFTPEGGEPRHGSITTTDKEPLYEGDTVEIFYNVEHPEQVVRRSKLGDEFGWPTWLSQFNVKILRTPDDPDTLARFYKEKEHYNLKVNQDGDVVYEYDEYISDGLLLFSVGALGIGILMLILRPIIGADNLDRAGMAILNFLETINSKN